MAEQKKKEKPTSEEGLPVFKTQDSASCQIKITVLCICLKIRVCVADAAKSLVKFIQDSQMHYTNKPFLFKNNNINKQHMF